MSFCRGETTQAGNCADSLSLHTCISDLKGDMPDYPAKTLTNDLM